MTGDLQLAAAFLAGLAGSGHCIGMCGAVVLLFERTAVERPLTRRFSYNAGRLCFYACSGAIAGAGGALLTRAAGVDTTLLVLRLAAALIVIALGLNLVFDLSLTRFLERAGARFWQRLSPLARHVLPVRSPPRAFAAGFLWGALPCGLVYSAVAIAATTGSVTGGALTMAGFWTGTLPALFVAGASAERLAAWRGKRRFRLAAGGAMLVIGGLALLPVRMLFD